MSPPTPTTGTHFSCLCLGRASNFSFLCLKLSDGWNAKYYPMGRGRTGGSENSGTETDADLAKKPLLKMFLAPLMLPVPVPFSPSVTEDPKV